jgi:hypothetical protein
VQQNQHKKNKKTITNKKTTKNNRLHTNNNRITNNHNPNHKHPTTHRMFRLNNLLLQIKTIHIKNKSQKKIK